MHQQISRDSKKERERDDEEAGHISQAPENVPLILGRVLLIDERGSV